MAVGRLARVPKSAKGQERSGSLAGERPSSGRNRTAFAELVLHKCAIDGLRAAGHLRFPTTEWSGRSSFNPGCANDRAQAMPAVRDHVAVHRDGVGHLSTADRSLAAPRSVAGASFMRSAFDANDLSKLVHHLDQVGLRRHDRVDRLVGARRLVDHAGVLAAFHARRGRGVVVKGEAPLRLAP
jgi:hypothetical protein